MPKKETINVKGTEIVLFTKKNEEYISLTDIAKHRDPSNPSQIISLWLRTYSTIEYLGLWEMLNNTNFIPHIYEGFKNESAKPHFWMSPQKWINETDAIGMISKSGRYGGGTFAHSDIAFKFAAWISAEFELYLVTEFKRLKQDEQRRLSLEWNLQRTLSKINYHIHTDAIKEHIIPNIVTKEQITYTYAEEADLLNVALFGMTAKQWRDANPDLKGNIRDYATLEQLVVLSNMESINALLIQQQLTQGERLVQLNNVAITQMRSLHANRRNVSVKDVKTTEQCKL
ncbi:MAG: KilA-N domain-containing protein [Lentimicrobiaceae bacterium]|nr:KilA-N domain-containing protein [Lentimicrobiaceae bacterium]